MGRPFHRQMRGDIAMQNSPRTDLHCDEDINDLERRHNTDEEVAGDDRLSVIANEGRPSLVGASPARRVGPDIFESFVAKFEHRVSR